MTLPSVCLLSCLNGSSSQGATLGLFRSQLALLAKPLFLWDKRGRGRRRGSSSRSFSAHHGNKLSFSTYPFELLCDGNTGLQRTLGLRPLPSELPGVSSAVWPTLPCMLGVQSALNVGQEAET